VAVGLYLILAPFIPDAIYYVQTYLRKDRLYTYQRTTNLRSNDVEQVQLFEGEAQPPDGENLLFIPKIGVQTPILEGKTSATLEKGIWHRPKSSTPELGSNTVFVAHRFLYTSGPNTFYNLDKLTVGDKFSVWWNKKRYEYEVVESKVVRPSEIYIESPTEESIVTLWSCTPVFTSKNRLVVTAKLIKRS